MRTVRGRAAPAWLGALAITLGVQAAALAKALPPSINDILGTYSVKYKQVLYNFGNGVSSKWEWGVNWEITSLSDNIVQIHTSTFNETFRARYAKGVLVWGNGDLGSPSEDANIGYAVFSGAAGKVKMKGMAGYSSLSWGMCETDALCGRMTVPNWSPVRVSEPVGRTEAAAPEEDESSGGKPSAGSAFPAIGDLVGEWSGKFSGTFYALPDGTTERFSPTIAFRIEPVDSETVLIDTGVMQYRGHYQSGILMVATVDDTQMAADSTFMLLLVKGKGWKVSFGGWFMATKDLGTVDPEFGVATFKAKRVE